MSRAARFLRRAAARLLPPIVREFLPGRHVWKGIYSHYRDVPVGNVSHDIYVGYTVGYTRAISEATRTSGTIPTETAGEFMLIGLLAALTRRKSEKLKVLDYAGGAGADFIHLTASALNRTSLEYHVVDIEGAAAAGASLFGSEQRIHFHSELPQIPDLDIVFLKSALCYIEEYPKLLRQLCGLEPTYFFFVNLGAGDFQRFATMQKNIRGAPMAYWFHNVGEIIDIVSSEGYKLIYKSAQEREYDQTNFPPEYRMPHGRHSNLLFERI